MRFSAILRTALSLLLLTAAAAVQAAPAGIQRYLPAASSVDAEFVVFGEDPGYDAFGQRLQAAMRVNAEWLRAYTTQHPGVSPLPYHPNFGVPKDQYLKYQTPMNHFIELSRQKIRIEKSQQGATIRLKLLGQQLLFDNLNIETSTPAVKTAKDSLEFRYKVDPGPATVPPGAHEGLSFVSPLETVKQRRFSERVLLGKLIGTSKGVIHYELSLPGKRTYAYVTYPLK